MNIFRRWPVPLIDATRVLSTSNSARSIVRLNPVRPRDLYSESPKWIWSFVVRGSPFTIVLAYLYRFPNSTSRLFTRQRSFFFSTHNDGLRWQRKHNKRINSLIYCINQSVENIFRRWRSFQTWSSKIIKYLQDFHFIEITFFVPQNMKIVQP